MIRFLQISDTHLGDTTDSLFHERNPFHYLKAVLAEVERLNLKPDFILHSGDVANNGDEAAVLLFSQEMKKFEIPIHYVVGNHDRREHLEGLLFRRAFRDMLENELTYSFVQQGVRFIVLDAWQESRIDGKLSDEALAFCRVELRSSSEPVVIVTHFPPVLVGSPWIDKNLLLQNGDELHALLCTFRSKVAGVLFGHLHQGLSMMKDGIGYFCCPSTVFQFHSSPQDSEMKYHEEEPPGFQMVSVGEDRSIIIRRYALHFSR